MAEKLIEINQGVLKRSIKQVMNDLTEDMREIRNKTPDIVAEKILSLSQGLVPVYTDTLRQSGHIEHKGEGATIVYDATVEEQRKAQEQMFGNMSNARIYVNVGQDPNDSYAEDVDARTKFLSGAIDLFNKGEPLKIKLKHNNKDYEYKLDIDIGKYGGYITRDDVISAKRKARARFTTKKRETQLKKQMKPYIETYGEKETNKMFFEETGYIQRRKREYNKKYKKIYGVRSK